MTRSIYQNVEWLLSDVVTPFGIGLHDECDHHASSISFCWMARNRGRLHRRLSVWS
jgi:hypothetical protein